ncbi:MAG: YggS family pyridoxal phosphate-dependent enzyme [Opitutaceae bacterium]|nr:YggS family pyridoxal phosphate-dependent enzyme [Opitutaceae bacterium]
MFLTYEQFLERLAAVRAAIADACHAAGRTPGSVTLLPVTKNHPPEAAHYAARAGLPAVGENRVQEAREKKSVAALSDLRWELIGHLQSNKAKLATAVFDRIQSVDSPRLLDLLERAAAEQGRTLGVLLQVNAGRDPAKSGCALEEAPELLERALRCRALRVDGLMTIAPLDEDLATARRAFEALRTCRDDLAARFGVALPELSMGMSGDLHEAILAGSTQVRVGTALFGARGQPVENNAA